MRSKRTSRYKQQHLDSDGDDRTFNLEEEIKQEIFEEIPKKKALTQHRKQNLNVNEQLYMLLVERSSELVLCFLDKHDIEKLARGKITIIFDILVVSVVWSSNVASYKLFSTIFKSIKGVVVDEAKSVRNVSKDKLIIK